MLWFHIPNTAIVPYTNTIVSHVLMIKNYSILFLIGLIGLPWLPFPGDWEKAARCFRVALKGSKRKVRRGFRCGALKHSGHRKCVFFCLCLCLYLYLHLYLYLFWADTSKGCKKAHSTPARRCPWTSSTWLFLLWALRRPAISWRSWRTASIDTGRGIDSNHRYSFAPRKDQNLQK